VGDFWDEVYGFRRFFVQFRFLEKPRVAAGSALEGGFRFRYAEPCVLERDGFQLFKCKQENFAFYLLEFADFHVNFRDFCEFFFFGDFGCGFDYGFGKCPFVHEKANTKVKQLNIVRKHRALVLGKNYRLYIKRESPNQFHVYDYLLLPSFS
jgi:hypothetical protein